MIDWEIFKHFTLGGLFGAVAVAGLYHAKFTRQATEIRSQRWLLEDRLQYIKHLQYDKKN